MMHQLEKCVSAIMHNLSNEKTKTSIILDPKKQNLSFKLFFNSSGKKNPQTPYGLDECSPPIPSLLSSIILIQTIHIITKNQIKIQNQIYETRKEEKMKKLCR